MPVGSVCMNALYNTCSPDHTRPSNIHNLQHKHTVQEMSVLHQKQGQSPRQMHA